MAIVTFKRGEVPQTMTPEDIARLEAMTSDEIQANALSDPDNPPWTNDELERAGWARNIRVLRDSLGMNPQSFAARFRIDLDRFMDWEGGRTLPDGVELSYLRVIARDASFVEQAVNREVVP